MSSGLSWQNHPPEKLLVEQFRISTGFHPTSPFPYFLSGVNQSNFITIRAVRSSIQVQVNGYDLASFADSSDVAGFIGVEMTPGSDRGKVAFSDVRVWQL